MTIATGFRLREEEKVGLLKQLQSKMNLATKYPRKRVSLLKMYVFVNKIQRNLHISIAESAKMEMQVANQIRELEKLERSRKNQTYYYE